MLVLCYCYKPQRTEHEIALSWSHSQSSGRPGKERKGEMVLKENYRPIFKLIFLYSHIFLLTSMCCSLKKVKVENDIEENQIPIFPSFYVFKGNLPLLNVFFQGYFCVYFVFPKVLSALSQS